MTDHGTLTKVTPVALLPMRAETHSGVQRGASENPTSWELTSEPRGERLGSREGGPSRGATSRSDSGGRRQRRNLNRGRGVGTDPGEGRDPDLGCGRHVTRGGTNGREESLVPESHGPQTTDCVQSL